MKSIFIQSLVFLISTTSFAAQQRILFVAPHPDDELVAMSTQIWKAQHSPRSKVDYRVVVMTCGDAYVEAFDLWTKSGKAQDLDGDGKITYLDLGVARHNETLNALRILGVPAEKVIFLGYPDGGLKDMTHTPGVYESALTHAKSVPYPFAYHYGAPYTAESITSDLKKLITSFKPGYVYSPTPTDMHPDHAETRVLVTQALAQVGAKPTHFEYLVHWEGKEKDWPMTTLDWKQPEGHVPPDLKISLSSVGLKRELKLQAIQQYVTQVAIQPDYINGFAKNQEMFWKRRGDVSDYLLSHENSLGHLMEHTIIGRDPKVLKSIPGTSH